VEQYTIAAIHVQYVLTFAYTRSKYENICSGSLFDTDEEIKNGAIDIIYASPETLVGGRTVV
jgi:hypothetical protein